MAHLLQALRAFGPKLNLNKAIHPNKLSSYLASRTGLKKGEVSLVVQELHETILFFTSQGIPVKIPGLGTFSPSIDRHGSVRLNLRVDRELRKTLNGPDFFTGEIVNKGNFNLANEEYKAMWDLANPDDPLALS